MEIEHSNDTSGQISASLQKQSLTSGVSEFMAKNKRDNKDVRLEAYRK